MNVRAFTTVLLVMLIALTSGSARSFGGAVAAADVAVQNSAASRPSSPLGIDVQKPRLSWMLNPAPNVRGQSAYRVLVASAPEILEQGRGDLWDSGRVASGQSTWIEYGGKGWFPANRSSGRFACGATPARRRRGAPRPAWSMGLLRSSDWHAKWIGQARPDGTAEGTALPFPWLRKTLTLAEKPRRAVAYVNPLGYYELYINGRKVDDHVLSPAVSDYSKRNLYVTHEVADYLVPGKNVIALWLGRGWYVKGHPGVIHDGPLVRAQLDITAAGGGSVQIVTDETWKLRESPLTPVGRGTAFGDYGGERYDAAVDLPGWNAVELDDSGWQAAAVFTPPEVLTASQMVEPNRMVETIKATRVDAFPKAAGSSTWGGTSRDGSKSSCRRLPGIDRQAGVFRPTGARQAGSRSRRRTGGGWACDVRNSPGSGASRGRKGCWCRCPAWRRASSRCTRRAGRGTARCDRRGPSRGEGRAWWEPDGSTQHVQPARRNRRQWRSGDVPLAVQLPRIPIRARHRRRRGAGRVKRHGVSDSHRV